MSAFVARASGVLRTAAAPVRRAATTQASVADVIAHNAHETEHAVGATATWRNVSLFVVPVALAIVGYKSFLTIPHPHQGEFVAYPHLRKRTKPFPWGDGNHSLFHNPVFNALPDGYEVEEPAHH